MVNMFDLYFPDLQLLRVDNAMTATADDDQIVFRIRSALASMYEVVNLQLIASSARLAFPPIPL